MEPREIRQSLEECSLGLLYALLGALSQAKPIYTEADSDGTCLIYSFEKEYCIKKIIIILATSDDPKGLMDKACQFFVTKKKS